MYHSGVNFPDKCTIGRAADCDIVLDHPSVSRLHACVEATPEGYLSVRDSDSANGTWLHRNGRWIRARRIVLGSLDRVRFGEQEVALERLVAAFGGGERIRLREGYTVRGKPLVFADPAIERARPRIVLENPRRNPLTGDIEENRKP